jgi:hypothetical protein
MSQTSCERYGLLVPMRWLHADGDLSRPDHGDQYAERPLMRPKGVFKCPAKPPDRPCAQSRSSLPGVAATIEVAASIKSP